VEAVRVEGRSHLLRMASVLGAAAAEKRNWLSRMLPVHGESFVTRLQVESCTTSKLYIHGRALVYERVVAAPLSGR
jgi:hypothetical protein